MIRIARAQVAGFVTELRTDLAPLHEFFVFYTRHFAPVDGGTSVVYWALGEGGARFTRDDRPFQQLRDVRDLWPSVEAAFIKDAIFAFGKLGVVRHATAVGRDGVADVYLGAANAGKSTLCARALRDGASFISDEAVLIREGRVMGFPRPLCFNDLENRVADLPLNDPLFDLRAYSFTTAQREEITSYFLLPRERVVPFGESLPLGRVSWLDPRPGAAPVIVPLAGRELTLRLEAARMAPRRVKSGVTDLNFAGRSP